MDRRSFGSLSPNIEDRRGEVLSPMEEARAIMEQPGVWDGSLIDQMPQAINPLGVQAGMLDMYRDQGLKMLALKMQGQAMQGPIASAVPWRP